MKYLILVLGLSMTGCAGSNPPLCQVVTPGAKASVFSFGDSITAGAGASTFCNAWEPEFTAKEGLVNDNLGISGSMMVTAQFDAVNFNLPKITQNDIVTILPGFNDISNFGGDAVHLQEFQDYLYQAAKTLSEHSKMVLIGTPLRASVEMQMTQIPNHTDAVTALYDDAVENVIDQLDADDIDNVYLVDCDAYYNPETM